jgi:hypothetical protein
MIRQGGTLAPEVYFESTTSFLFFCLDAKEPKNQGQP